MTDYLRAVTSGRKLRMEEQGNGNFGLSLAEAEKGRSCGGCQLCCKLVPVFEDTFRKPAGTRCQHAKHGKGCTIYARRPESCIAWSCRWLSDPLTAGLPRPDRSHCVIDLETDLVTRRFEDGSTKDLPVLQVWVDPAYPDAWKAPAMLTWLQAMAERFGYAAIVRLSSHKAIVVVAPALSGQGWVVVTDGVVMARNEQEAGILAMARQTG